MTGLPGTDLLRALQTMFFDGLARQGEFTLWFDFFCALLLIVTTALAPPSGTSPTASFR
ncbi:MAG: hypothetical protein M5U34_29185 [Chloroflexi bacterium]|nr:hypothetical protein [Chloroflexota bacterium]